MGNDVVRGFYWTRKSYYWRNNEEPSIEFGNYDVVGGGTTGEMCMTWYNLNSKDRLFPRLEVFSDAWKTLDGFQDVITGMANLPEDPTEEEFVELLIRLGFRDLTKYTRGD